MAVHRIKKGLDLPIAGAPKQEIAETVNVRRVAIIADDFVGMKPRMLVDEGDAVKRGQPIFEDRKKPGVLHTAPGAGIIEAINRGAQRRLHSVVIKLSESEVKGEPVADDFAGFPSWKKADNAAAVDALSRDDVVKVLVESGLWTALRARPFSVVPLPEDKPYALFVNGMDSNPLAPDPKVVIKPRQADFDLGLRALARLTEGKTHLCVAAGSPIKGFTQAPVNIEEFSGPHPAGTTGVHMHFIAPVSRQRVAWGIAYQDVLAIGKLMATGQLDVSRVVSLAGPVAKNPRLVSTRMGASLHDLIEDADAIENAARAIAGDEPDVRIISGSAISGKRSQGSQFGYLNRYHVQVTLLKEGREREFLGWLGAGFNKFSNFRVFASGFFGMGKTYNFTTDTNGSPRAMVPIGQLEKVMPMDILPTFLLRSLIVGDIETAEKLGVLELDEEDLALCTFACTSKTNYGPLLRANLEKMRLEG